MRILSLAPLAGPGVDALRALGELEIDPWSEHVPFRIHAPDELAARAVGVDVLLVEADFVTAEVFERTNLTIVGSCRGDPNNVDIEAATRAGVAVLRAPGRNANAVAELTIGLMLALLRKVMPADADVRAARWIIDGVLPQQRHGGRELRSMTVGIAGFGAVGRRVAELARAFGSSVIAYDPFVAQDEMRAVGVDRASSLIELMASADIVTIHAPLNASTRGSIGADELAALRHGSYLVNTARYGIVDEEPLLDALRSGTLAGAAFDHFENEFLDAGHPLIGMPNVVLTPHIGGTTRETVENHTMQMAEGIAAILAGKAPPTLVNPGAVAATS